MLQLITDHHLYTVDFDVPVRAGNTKLPMRFVTSSKRLAVSLEEYRCQPRSRNYEDVNCSECDVCPITLCNTMLGAMFGYNNHTPMLACVPVQDYGHREHEVVLTDFAASPASIPVYAESLACDTAPAAVTKQIDYKDVKRDPKAIAAIQKEGRALVDADTWLEETVIERDDLVKNAQKSGETIHLGDLLTICSIKFWERVVAEHMYKGRICFRGDNVRDEQGAVAVFQELSANPTSVHSANSNIAYGCIPGNKSTVADAVRAYVQSLLKSKHKTWVQIPKELWPKKWHGKNYRRPMCLLKMALYGHPESGGHWERHLTEAVVSLGGAPVTSHPSSFWFAESKLLLTIYVDDLLLSGPEANHADLWDKLGKKINIDPPEALDRFLGRHHLQL